MSILDNKQISFDFEILEEYESGIELQGTEVKSLRLKRGSLKGSRIVIRGNEAFLVGAEIPAYQQGNTRSDYEKDRTRKLLLTDKEIKELGGKLSQKGLTAIPVSVYNKGRFFKLKFAVVRAKKKHDKRAKVKERETNRVIERTLKRQYD